MKHELDDNAALFKTVLTQQSLDDGVLVNAQESVPLSQDERYAFFESIKASKLSEYKRQRAAEYPPITDYIDGVVKGDQSQVDAYIQACLAVKAKFPKPNQE